MEYILQLSLTGLMVGMAYSLIAVGIVLIFKSSGIFNFAQGEFLLLGGYIGWMFAVQLGLNIWVSIVLTLVSLFAIGLGTERIFLRRMIGRPVFAAITLTIGISYMLRGVVTMIWWGQPGVYPALFPAMPLQLGFLRLPLDYVCMGIVSLLAIAIFVAFYRYTRLGLHMMATAEDHQVSQALGINVKRVFSLSWGISALIAGVAAILLAAINGVNASFNFFGMKAFPVVILGGAESVMGALVGGLIIGLAEYLAMGLLDPFLPGFSSLTPFLVLMIIILIRPFGLFGSVKVERI
jgi:branched-chain amino acid transport system permease protein